MLYFSYNYLYITELFFTEWYGVIKLTTFFHSFLLVCLNTFLVTLFVQIWSKGEEWSIIPLLSPLRILLHWFLFNEGKLLHEATLAT